jgi:hypothetical protein
LGPDGKIAFSINVLSNRSLYGKVERLFEISTSGKRKKAPTGFVHQSCLVE